MNQEIVGNSVLIIGSGRECLSVVRYLNKKFPAVTITIADQNPDIPKIPGTHTITGDDYLQSIQDYDTVVRSPGISKTSPKLLKANHVTTATNIFFAECPGMIIGVTGTKGKSTTSSLIHHILKSSHKDVRLVGNIGRPSLDDLEGATTNTVFVCELSSYQLDDIRYSPHIAVILPISPEHLTYHGSYADYIAAKSHIVDKQTDEDFVIYAISNNNATKIAANSPGHHMSYPANTSQSIGVWIENDTICYKIATESKKLMPRIEIPLLGIAAITVALLVDIDSNIIRDAIKTFKPLEHRLELIGEYQGIQFYNDSLATTPVATIHALEALQNKVTTLIAGGFNRDLDFKELGEVIAHSSIKTLILFPDTGASIAQEVKNFATNDIRIIPVSTMKDAVHESYLHTTSGGICLMSPAAASFNLFKDYADRGNSFKKWVVYYNHKD
jgi:UDP-N-acetylmuramoylalanine--D-glutamate ligase